MNVAPRPCAEGQDLGAPLGHLVVAALLGIGAPPVAAGEPLPAPRLQRPSPVGIHDCPLLAIGGPALGAFLVGARQVGARHGDELIEIHPVHPARHHIRDILAPHGLILPRQTEDEIRHDHRLVVAGQRRQPGQQGLPVIEAGRLLAHAGIKTLHAEREAIEATRQGRLPLLVIKAVEPPLQGQLRIHGQGKTADGAGQADEIARRHVGWRAAPHIDRRERPALDERRLGCLVQRPAECLHVATHARRIGAVFEEVAKTAALAAKRDMDIKRPGLGLALLLPPGLPAGIVQHQGGGPSPAGMGRRLGGEGEFEGIRGAKPRHGRRKLESRHWVTLRK